MKFFNTAGPCRPNRHYMLSATERLKAFNVMHLIGQDSYFILHAPRQVGKTTAILELARQLTASGEYISVVLSCEVGAPFHNDIDKAERFILSDWVRAIRYQLPEELRSDVTISTQTDNGLIGSFLADWSFSAPRPLVIFLDEIDALEDQVLISVLRQLRSGYYRRPEGFPASLAVTGLRDIRDYKVQSGGSNRLRSPSPFNIAVCSITLRMDRYLSGLGLETGWLVIFDQRTGQPPIEEKTSAEIAQTPSGRTITLVRA